MDSRDLKVQTAVEWAGKSSDPGGSVIAAVRGSDYRPRLAGDRQDHRNLGGAARPTSRRLPGDHAA